MIPIFIITFNQFSNLGRVIASYRRLSTPVDIIVHDNGSDHPAMLSLLDQLARDDVKVFYNSKISTAADLNNVSLTVEEYFRGKSAPTNYVVTDPDIDLSCADPDSLRVYGELLDAFPSAQCVGPMLRIDDIPRSYPLRAAATDRHIEQFWKHRPKWVTTSWGRVAYQEARIDTTFALHRAGEKFSRLKKGIRVYYPFEAHHLDWYIDEHEATDGSFEISHWSKRGLIERHRDRAFVERKFFKVGEVEGKLRTFVCSADASGCTPLEVLRDDNDTEQ